MKKLILFLFAITTVLAFTSCLKPKHEIRVKNTYSDSRYPSLRVIIGPNDYGSVPRNTTTSYQSIPEGSHTLGGDLFGTVSVTGRGSHKWTLTITPAGGFSILEDK